MNIVYLVNGISKTSIPWRWYDYFNRYSKSSQIKILPLKKFIKELWRDRDIEIVHGHHIKSMAIFLIFNSIFRIKSIYTVHGSYLFLSKSNSILLRFIFRFTDRVAFVNKILYDVLPISYKSIIRDKYKIILNGVEIDYRYKKIDICKKFNIKKDEIIFFHPARFVTEKNHLRLIEAMKPIIDKNSSVKLYLAGSGVLEGEIISLISKVKLEKNIILLGLIDRDDVYNFLEECELFLMPSISEGLNISFLEAISMNSKIVVSDIEQFSYPLEHYNLDAELLNITLVNPFNKDSIRYGIEKSLKDNRNVTYKSKEFSLESMMDSYEKIYKSINRG